MPQLDPNITLILKKNNFFNILYSLTFHFRYCVCVLKVSILFKLTIYKYIFYFALMQYKSNKFKFTMYYPFIDYIALLLVQVKNGD